MKRRPALFAMRTRAGPLRKYLNYSLTVLMLYCWMSTNAQAERRVALLIGNAEYTRPASGKLNNPVNDVRDMYAKLQTLGFQKRNIVYREDLKVSDIGATLAEFSRKLAGEGDEDRDTVALIYYSGHGLQVNDKNYLPAVNAKIDNEFSVKYQSIVVSDLLDILESGKSRVNLVLLDSCRDSPFSVKYKSLTRGLAKEPPPEGIWIWYATRPGQVADDGDGRNSPFTTQLLKHIGTPGLSIKQMFDPVVAGVKEATRHKERKQEPWPEGWISGDFFFVQSTTVDKPVTAPIAQPQPGQPLPKDCTACPELVLLPAGSFVMGSPAGEKDREGDEGLTRPVRIDRQIAVGRNEVSRGEFAQFVAAAGYKTEAEKAQGCAAWDGKEWKYDAARHWRNPGFEQGDDHPVVCVSWNDAQAYLRWLNTQAPGRRYRLLSEAEWEYAARAGQGAWRFPWGDDLSYSEMCRFSNGADETARTEIPGADGWAVSNCSDGYAYTAPPFAFQPNAFGLYHMHGNVWEWLQDLYHENYTGAPADGSAWEIGGDATRRVLRGGSWYDIPRDLRSAGRFRIAPDYRFYVTGFRVARTF